MNLSGFFEWLQEKQKEALAAHTALQTDTLVKRGEYQAIVAIINKLIEETQENKNESTEPAGSEG